MIEQAALDDIAAVLQEPEIARKLDLGARLCARRGRIGMDRDSVAASAPDLPARPAHWTVLPPHAVPRRGDLKSAAGRCSLLHAVAHIELAAVELALLAVLDFPEQEGGYHRAMLHIAGEEIEHARMLQELLSRLGSELGAEPVHHGLWTTARRFPGVIERLAVVPRILEAKGLDVSAGLRQKLTAAGDAESASCLDRIYRDEIGHVAVGTRWYRRICERTGIDSERHFAALCAPFRSRRPVPLDLEGRRRAGFTEFELHALQGNADSSRGEQSSAAGAGGESG